MVGLSAKVLKTNTKIDDAGTPYTEYLTLITRENTSFNLSEKQEEEVAGLVNNTDKKAIGMRVNISVLDFIDTLMYHCAAFTNVSRIPEELRTECDFGRQTGQDNS